MAKSSTSAQRARNAARTAGSNPYLRRVVEDEELRASVVTAFDAAKQAYERLSSNGNVIDTAIDDKKLHGELKTAAENLREASQRLRGEEEKKRRLGRLLVIAIAGAVLALVLSEGLRKTVLDALFGAEEEFEYTSTTTTPAPATTTS